MSPKYVRRYVKAQKYDDRDAKAIADGGDMPNKALRRINEPGAVWSAHITSLA
jgi:hypothetical protein